MSVLVLPQRLREEIEAEAMSAYPNECCGIMVGREEAGAQMTRRLVDRIVPTQNVETADPSRRFVVDPHTLLRVEKEAAAQKRLVLGFYHSHPDHPARPSETDLANAWDYYSYVIVNVRNKLPVEMTSWVLSGPGGRFRSQDIYRH